MAAVEAVILLGQALQYALDPPGEADSGGPQMALFFRFASAGGSGNRDRAALVRADLQAGQQPSDADHHLPPFGLAYWGAREIQITRGVAELRSGRGYFTDPNARALGEAVVNRDLAAVTRLAPLTNVNAEGRTGTTFLKLALNGNDFDLSIVQASLAAGADPNNDGAWPVGIAIYYGSAPLLALVLAAGGDPNTLDNLEIPIFFRAAEHPELLAQLLAGGARIEATDFRRRTMLLDATRERNWEAANVLLDRGANRAAADRDGKGVIELLREARQKDEDNGRSPQPGMSTLDARLRESR